MKKPVVFGVVFAFMAAVALYAAGGLQTVYAAVAWQCTKCGLVIHSDPHDGGYDPSCPNRGIHSFVQIDGSAAATSSYQSSEPANNGSHEAAGSYRCTKCGKVIHSDPHHGGYDPACPEGGIHSWVAE